MPSSRRAHCLRARCLRAVVLHLGLSWITIGGPDPKLHGCRRLAHGQPESALGGCPGAAAASRHDSLEAYDRAELPRLLVFDDLDTWSIVSLITRARLVVTTSLHVQVIAALWGVPRLQLSFHEKLDSNLAEFESPSAP